MVDRLVEKGALIREHSTQDRRKVVVRIAPKAIKHAEAVEGAIMALFVRLAKRIGPDTTAQWCQALERIKSVVTGEVNDQPIVEPNTGEKRCKTTKAPMIKSAN